MHVTQRLTGQAFTCFGNMDHLLGSRNSPASSHSVSSTNLKMHFVHRNALFSAVISATG